MHGYPGANEPGGGVISASTLGGLGGPPPPQWGMFNGGGQGVRIPKAFSGNVVYASPTPTIIGPSGMMVINNGPGGMELGQAGAIMYPTYGGPYSLGPVYNPPGIPGPIPASPYPKGVVVDPRYDMTGVGGPQSNLRYY